MIIGGQQEERQQALFRYNILKPFLEDGVSLVTLVKASNKSIRTLSDWVQKYRKDGLVGLVKKKRDDSGKNRGVNEETKLFLEGLALSKPRLSITAIYRTTTAMTAKNGWRPPSYRTIYEIVKRLDPAMIILAQEGGKAYSEKYDLLYKRESTYPNEIWQADHSLLDVWLVDDNGKHKRPWITIIMDDYSRAVAGYFLTFQSPNTQNTSLVLRQAIWHKDDPLWHVCGIPETFYTDHGSDFTSLHLEQVSADIKMRLAFSLPGKPRGRGIIERFFATINQLFLCHLSGYMPEGKYPDKSPTLKLHELDAQIKAFLITTYNMRIHSETNMSPQERWEKGDFIPRLPQSVEQLDLLLLTEAKARKIHPDGIHFQKFKYIDTTLAAYVGETVIILYDPRDMAEIRVYHQNKFLCRAISQELARNTISLKDIIRARNQRKRLLKDEIKSRTKMVDLLLASHAEETPDYLILSGTGDTQQQVATKPAKQIKLKRYYNE